MMTTASSLPIFFVTGWLLFLARRRKRRGAKPRSADERVGANVESDLLVVHASQTGTAERLARMTAAAFAETGRPVRLLPISALDPAALARAQQAFFVVSTYGEGQPPDLARAFAKRVMATRPGYGELDYAVLALGDREYANFCGFGRDLDIWLKETGARPLFELVEMGVEEVESERRWSQHLAAFGARIAPQDRKLERFGQWQIVARTLLNAESQGRGAYHIRLRPRDSTLPDWQAGDIAEIRPRNDPRKVADMLRLMGCSGAERVGTSTLSEHLERSVLPSQIEGAFVASIEEMAGFLPLRPREYSIASIPDDGTLDLLVRQVVLAGGGLGVGSGWLTSHAEIGAFVDLRIRTNPGFRRPSEGGPLILVGNGTGLAGLRAHLRESRRCGSGGHWLLFGERNAATDAFFSEEIGGWLRDGTLARADFAWSRDEGECRYVQDLLAGQAAAIAAWMSQGATILVCGSLEGMAPAVDQALGAILGRDALDDLTAACRYLRDVY